MVTGRSSFWLGAAALALLGLALTPSTLAQSEEDPFRDPFRQEQVAYANGFIEAVKYVEGQMSEGRLDAEGLKKLVENRSGRLRELVVEKSLAYQQVLIKLNRSGTKPKPAAGESGGLNR